jgi:hypothetical protein
MLKRKIASIDASIVSTTKLGSKGRTPVARRSVGADDLNYLVRMVTPQGEQRIYWGKDLPRALEEAEAKVGECITATRVASKPDPGAAGRLKAKRESRCQA